LSVGPWQDCARGKSVGRLPEELHLTPLPAGKNRERQGSLAQAT